MTANIERRVEALESTIRPIILKTDPAHRRDRRRHKEGGGKDDVRTLLSHPSAN